MKKRKHQDRYLRIGLNIAMYRKLKHMTQLELAEKINVSRTHISNIEAPNSVTIMSLDLIFDIADALDIQPEDLMKFN